METETTRHPFETRGLGTAPFRFTGMVTRDTAYGEAIVNRAEYERTGVRMTTDKPGGSCDHCGAYIVDMYGILSSDGRRFKVGSTCVEKTADRGLIAAVKRATRVLAREKRQARATAKRAAIEAALREAETQERLYSEPHPHAAMAARGMTRFHWAGWMLARAGAKGIGEVAKYLGL